MAVGLLAAFLIKATLILGAGLFIHAGFKKWGAAQRFRNLWMVNLAVPLCLITVWVNALPDTPDAPEGYYMGLPGDLPEITLQWEKPSATGSVLPAPSTPDVLESQRLSDIVVREGGVKRRQRAESSHAIEPRNRTTFQQGPWSQRSKVSSRVPPECENVKPVLRSGVRLIHYADNALLCFRDQTMPNACIRCWASALENTDSRCTPGRPSHAGRKRQGDLQLPRVHPLLGPHADRRLEPQAQDRRQTSRPQAARDRRMVPQKPAPPHQRAASGTLAESERPHRTTME